MKIKKIVLVSFVFALLFALSACNSSAKDYQKALALMDSMKYQAAIEIFTNLSGYEDSADKIIQCKYALAQEAVDAEDWNTAIDYLTGMTYQDSADLLADCEREKGMTENSDYAFLADIEAAVLNRIKMNTQEDYDNTSIVNTELGYLEKYSEQTFYDPALKALAEKYIEGLHTQKGALDEALMSDMQIEWQRGIVNRYEVLRDLYDNYGFLRDNQNFYGIYVADCERMQNLLTAYQELEADIAQQTDTEDFHWYIDGSKVYCTLKNNTKYQYSTAFELTIANSDDVVIAHQTVYVDNINPDETYQVIAYVNDPQNVAGLDWNNYYTDVKLSA